MCVCVCMCVCVGVCVCVCELAVSFDAGVEVTGYLNRSIAADLPQ